MSTILGTVRSAGQGVEGLQVVAFEEVRIGIEVVPNPCRSSHPTIRQVGETTTDYSGNYQIEFAETAPFEEACSFSARVHITVLDGSTLVWKSPKKSVAAKIRFDPGILPELVEEPAEEGAFIRGRLTFCGRPATGHRVVAFENTQVGFPVPPKPCRKSSPSTRSLGAVVVDADGRFEIPFEPSEEPPSACFFSQRVFVEAFDGPSRVWRSPDASVSSVIRFDQELSAGCEAGDTAVRVVNGTGHRMRGAEVFHNGRFRGLTDELGHLFLDDVEAGDMLAARVRVRENQTDRDAHDVDSDQNWNYRAYWTSVPITHDANGDAVQLPLFQVTDPGEVQEVRVRRRNALVAFNLRASVEWDATREELLYFRDRLIETSELVYNATDGQFLIERLEIADNGRYWDQADIRIYASLNTSSRASVDGIAGAGGHLLMNPIGAFFPGTFLHELGHYAFGVLDEYTEGEGWDPAHGPVRCTLASNSGSGPFSNGQSKDTCLMRGSQDESRKKFCSGHPDNPHVDGTRQGPLDCWSDILARYGGASMWRLHTPVSRGAIVGRLPDSGVPLPFQTTPPARADQAGSYIPVSAWLPRWHISSVDRPDECPDLVVRVELLGVPQNGAEVYVRAPSGRVVHQGRTSTYRLMDGRNFGDGEIPVRGVHVGDTISVSKFVDGSGWLFGEGTVGACGTAPLTVVALTPGPVAVAMRCRPGTLGECEILVEGDRGLVAPPSLSLLLAGEDELQDVQLRPGRTGGSFTARVTDLPADQDLELQVVAFDAQGNQALIRTTVALRTLHTGSELQIFSVDGGLEVVLPVGALPAPTQVAIEQVAGGPLPGLAEGDALFAGPYRAGSTAGDRLRKPALLHVNASDGLVLDPQAQSYRRRFELLWHDEDNDRWQAVPSTLHEEPFVVTARIERLGTYALVERKAPDEQQY